jgi:hypothetical protein
VSRLNDLLASAFPVVCVVAGSSLIAVFIVAWLVRGVAERAIEKASPDQVAAVLRALPGLIIPFRGIWPWSGKSPQPIDADEDRTGRGAAGETRI